MKQSFAIKLKTLASWFRESAARKTISSPSEAKTDKAASVPVQEPVRIAGLRTSWLRVLSSQELLQYVHAQRAIEKIWQQSRLSHDIFQRDLLPAIHAYAEFVQLMPASEAHHHAHVGGLLSHTIEMVLAAVTWRNGHLLPEGQPIEIIDAQRDHWTYVVFFCALLHDVAKPMTDLRISWTCKHMSEPLRWSPMAGSLAQVTQGRAQSEYLVEFMPKAARDYSAHAKLAQMLLPRIVPAPALAFLSTQPATLELLNRYLSGQDRESLVAQIVRKADGLSAQKALQNGSQARFATAKAMPLVDLLMQAVGAMLRNGTSLPLNRSGAAGWVYDGAIWFVAKRVADATRQWIKLNEPEQTVPGDTKNDRLFDTWQDYAIIERNPHTGQAVWYVTVHGQQPGEEQVSYQHQLTMLKFPLSKIYGDPSQYPESMQGHIEVRANKADSGSQTHAHAEAAQTDSPETEAESCVQEPEAAEMLAPIQTEKLNQQEMQTVKTEAAPMTEPEPTPAQTLPQRPQDATPRKTQREKFAATGIKEPVFRKPAVAKASLAQRPKTEADKAKEHVQKHSPQSTVVTRDPEDAAYLLDDSILREIEDWLSHEETATAVSVKAIAKPDAKRERDLDESGTINENSSHVTHVKSQASFPDLLSVRKPLEIGKLPKLAGIAVRSPIPELLVEQTQSNSAGKDAEQAEAVSYRVEPEPVLLRPKLPQLPPGDEAGKAVQVSPLAMEFMQWLQESLVSREVKYNETGALVHFVPEGMALVSPVVFKHYASTLTVDAQRINELGMQVQKAVIKAGWHLEGANRQNIVKYAVRKGEQEVSRLSAVVLEMPSRWVQPVPPSNPVLKLL